MGITTVAGRGVPLGALFGSLCPTQVIATPVPDPEGRDVFRLTYLAVFLGKAVRTKTEEGESWTWL
jgi:hypothetical protein